MIIFPWSARPFSPSFSIVYNLILCRYQEVGVLERFLFYRHGFELFIIKTVYF